MDLGVSAARPKSHLHSLDSSIGEPEPHGLTVRVAPHALRRYASIAARLTSGDEWPSRPSCRGGTSSLNHKFCVSERGIFLRPALDSSGRTGGVFLVFCPSGRRGQHSNRTAARTHLAEAPCTFAPGVDVTREPD